MPASVDWRDKGAISAVKNQGGCGSCTAFATVGTLEASMIKSGAPISDLDLSEQQFIDCGHGSCRGAFIGWYLDWIRKTTELIGYYDLHP